MNNLGLSLLKKRIFKRAALSTVGTALFNSIGIWLGLYTIMWWYDMPLHFFGGVFTGLLVIWILLHYGSFAFYSTVKTVFLILSLVLIFGFAWELYEFFIKTVIYGQKFIFTDSLSDVFFDLAGGLEACFIYFRHKKEILLK